MTIRPIIRGVGLVTPLGSSAGATWEALLSGSFITDHATAPTITPAGGRRVSHLASLAASDAIADAGWTPNLLSNEQTALIVGTSKGAIIDWITPLPESSPFPTRGFTPTMMGSIVEDLVGRWGMSGPRLTISAACASGLQALIRAACMIRAGRIRRALVVASEASVHPLFLGSFQRLGVLARPGAGCRPLDVHRDGFLMSEAAAAVCLDAAGPGVWVDACALGGDAHHLTGSDPRGTVLRRLLRTVCGEEPLDLIHSHATGTKIHDPIELSAIHDIAARPGHPPTVYSHKGALGHSLGAAGLLSVVLNVLCHRRGLVPGNIRTSSPIPAPGLHIDRKPVDRVIHRSIAIAAGFGGASAAIGLRSE